MSEFYRQLRSLGLPAMRAFVGAKMLATLRRVFPGDVEFVASGLRVASEYQFAQIAAKY